MHSISDKVHVWDGANIVADVDGNDVVVYIRGINLIYADDGDKIYYHFNAHGDVVVLTDEDGSKTKSYSYNAFGVEYNEATLDDNPFRYCGEYYDKETKTIYLRARYYNAEQARFTQEDPIRDGYNWYSYCGGNPVNFIDPTGYAVASCFGDIPDLLGGGNDVLSYGLCGGGDGSANNSVTNYGYATEPTIPEFIEEPIDGTYSVGLCGSASWSHIGINGQIGLSFDAKGNVAIQGSVSLEVTTSSDAAVNGGVYQTITNAPDITKLEDQGSAFGTTISVPIKGPLALNAGTDVNIIPDEEADTYYWGLTSVRGIGYSPKPSAEAHFSHGTTKTLVSFNIFKIWDDIYNGK